jgi:hypothetical protein
MRLLSDQLRELKPLTGPTDAEVTAEDDIVPGEAARQHSGIAPGDAPSHRPPRRWPPSAPGDVGREIDAALERRRHEHPDVEVLLAVRSRSEQALRDLLGDQDISPELMSRVVASLGVSLGVKASPHARQERTDRTVDAVCGLGQHAARVAWSAGR